MIAPRIRGFSQKNKIKKNQIVYTAVYILKNVYWARQGMGRAWAEHGQRMSGAWAEHRRGGWNYILYIYIYIYIHKKYTGMSRAWSGYGQGMSRAWAGHGQGIGGGPAHALPMPCLCPAHGLPMHCPCRNFFLNKYIHYNFRFFLDIRYMIFSYDFLFFWNTPVHDNHPPRPCSSHAPYIYIYIYTYIHTLYNFLFIVF